MLSPKGPGSKQLPIRMIGGRQPPWKSVTMFSMDMISLTSWCDPSRSALLITKMSAISMIPALIAWISSPIPGTRTTMTVWEWLIISTSCCPVPTVSTRIKSLPMTSITWTASPTAFERPPSAPRVARLRTKTPGSSACRCIRIRSPRMAPPVKGEVGSTARTPTVFSRFRKEEISASTRVLFPAPGDPVIPTTCARPVWGKIRRMAFFASGSSSSRFRIRREAVRTSPSRILRTCSIPSNSSVMQNPSYFRGWTFVRTHWTIVSSGAPGVKIALMPAS